MQELKQNEIHAVHGAGVCLAAGLALTSLGGMTVGGLLGANYYEPAINYLNPKEPSLVGQARDYFISYKLGHLGLDSKKDIMGAAGGTLVGAVLAPALVALFI